MRCLCLLFVACTASAKVGAWGEDPSKVPAFAPVEERRAPKVPAGDKLWKEFQTDRERDRFADSLLVCLVQIGPKQNVAGRVVADVATFGLGELANADATLRFKFRNDPQIMLWGPRKHNAFYISVPALTLARGDRIDLALVDRGLFSNKPLGHASLTWDGHAPFTLTAPKWNARCTLLDSEELTTRAQPWIASVDELLARVAGAQVDRAEVDFGRPSNAIAQLQGRFRNLSGEGNFRYAAGFYGWAHPEIQTRLGRLRDAVRAFDLAAAREVVALWNESAAPLELDGKRLRLSKQGGTIAVRIDGSDCAALQKQLADSWLIDAAGDFHPTRATLKGADGKCLPETSGSLRGSLRGPARARLLRLPDGRVARLDGR